MRDFALFLGRFHVLALHLPIAIVLAAVAADWTARATRFRTLAVAAPFLWGAAAVSAVGTVLLGYLHFAEGAFTGPSAAAHRAFGTTLGVVCVALAWLARRPALHARLNVVTGFVAVVLVAITGHFGGDLTHGSTFLWEYAPGPLRALAGAGERRARPASVAAADPYRDIVQPLLELRCGGCHNDDKLESGFSVSTYESTLAGGDSGNAITPGDSESSQLVHRVSRSPDDEDFMPADGKTPLTAAQVAIVRWWADAGAPHDATVASVGVPADVEALLAAEFGLGNPAAAADSANGSGGVPAAAPVSADAALVARLYAAGFLARQVSQSDARLVVSVYSAGTRVGADALAALATGGASIVELNLQDAAVGDDAVSDIVQLTGLERLRVSRNELTDRGVAVLAGLPRLVRLNLYGNPGISDGSIDALAAAAALRRLDVWQTAITDEGIARLRQRRPDLDVQGGAAPFDSAVTAPAAPTR